MKVYVQNDKLNWIIDEIVADYKRHTRHEIVKSNPDVAWCMSFRDVHQIEHFNCPKIVTVHHIEPHKVPGFKHLFDAINKHNITCFVPNEITRLELKKHVKTDIHRVPYWLLSPRMAKSRTDIVANLRSKYIDDGEIVIGSFQKDSTGNTIEPKLSKGPDILLEVLKELNKEYNIKVILAGFSRKYIIYNLRKLGIKHHYFHRYENINDLYDLLDWYFVTSRVEGGPQAVLEAPYRDVNILSTKVGIAPAVLNDDCLCSSAADMISKFKSAQDYRYYNKLMVKALHRPEYRINITDLLLEDICKTS